MQNATHIGPLVTLAASAETGRVTRIELIPVGDIGMRDGRGSFHLPNAADVIARSMAAAPGGELPIDFDHALDGKGDGNGLAAGWIKELTVEGDRIIANVEWTDVGAKAIEAKHYKFISPVFSYAPKTRQVLRIERAGLTNNPAMPQLRKIAASCQENNMDPDLIKVAEAFGLTAEAAPADIIAAAQAAVTATKGAEKIVTAAGLTGNLTDEAATAICAKLSDPAEVDEPDPTKYVPIAVVEDLNKQVASLTAGIAEDRAEKVITAAQEAGKLPPAQLDWAQAYASKDPDGFAAWCQNAPVVASAQTVVPGGEPKPAKGELTEAEKAICAATGVDPAQYLAVRDTGTLKEENA